MPEDKEEFSSQPPQVRPSPEAHSPATYGVIRTIQTGEMLLERVQQVCRHYGLTLSTANALAIVDGAGESLSPGVIGSRLLVTGGAVTQILDALEQRGLVRRVPNPYDRRSILIEITEAGRRLRRQYEPHLNRRDAVWMGGLNSEEQEQLAALLEKVQAHLQNHPVSEE